MGRERIWCVAAVLGAMGLAMTSGSGGTSAQDSLEGWSLPTVEEFRPSRPAPAPAPQRETSPPPENRGHARPDTGDRIRPGQVFRDCPDCPVMVAIPPGEFMMGITEVGKKLSAHFDDNNLKEYDELHSLRKLFDAPKAIYWEAPRHPVRISSAFALGKYEVTRGEYAAFVRNTGRPSDGDCLRVSLRSGNLTRDGTWRSPGFSQSDPHPVVCVSWRDATAYAAWLTRRTGKPYRLVTEAEWEYAARAQTVTMWYWGDFRKMQSACSNENVFDKALEELISSLDDREEDILCRDGYIYTDPVGSFAANRFGLHDMLGNVMEFTLDCWHEGYRGAPADGTAWMNRGCGKHVVRGGAWLLWSALQGRAAFRSYMDTETDRTFLTGFRVARSL